MEGRWVMEREPSTGRPGAFEGQAWTSARVRKPALDEVQGRGGCPPRLNGRQNGLSLSETGVRKRQEVSARASRFRAICRSAALRRSGPVLV